ncbi:ABC transporter substrate-binding protein [Candidatus Woesearchaeota archaeon]|nr:ABC transporter substrate-binding protein [Candidatus Woesearchaeota archaeon]
MKQTITIILLVLLVIGLGGCMTTPTGKAVQQAQLEEEPIKIGFIGPLTGEMAALGINNLKGIQVAVNEINSYGGINGKQIELISEDDQGMNVDAVNAYRKLKDVDEVNAVMLPLYTTYVTVAEFADRDKFLIIDSLDTSEEIADMGEYSFAIGIYDEGIGITIADFVYKELGETEVGLAYNIEDAFMALVREGFMPRYEELGGEILVDEEFDFSTTDFRSILLKADYADVDTLIVLGYDESGFLLRQAEEIGFDFTFVGSDMFSSQNFRDNAGGAEQGAYFTFWNPPNSPEYKSFLSRYKAIHGEEPHEILFSAIGYDALHVLASAMSKSDLSTDAIKNQLYRVKDFKGLSGTLTMSGDGIVRSVKESIFRIEGKNFVEI